MIHLSKISINPQAIAYINWKAESNFKPAIRVFFLVGSSSSCPEWRDFLADSEDAKILARELKRPDCYITEPSSASVLADAE